MQNDFSGNAAPIIDEYLILWSKKKAIEARMKQLDPEVRGLVEGLGRPGVCGDYRVECTMQPGRKTFDKKAAAEAGVDVERFMKTGAPFTRLAIKVVE